MIERGAKDVAVDDPEEVAFWRLGEIDDRIVELQRTRQELQTLAARAQTIQPENCPPSAICRIIETDTAT